MTEVQAPAADPEPCCSAGWPVRSALEPPMVADYPAMALAGLRLDSRAQRPEAAGSAQVVPKVAADCREAAPSTVRRRWESEDSPARWASVLEV